MHIINTKATPSQRPPFLPPFPCTTARHMATALNVSKSRKSVPVCESVWQHNYHPHSVNYTGRKKKVYMRKQEVSNNKNH